jgi:phenylpyruvate tautomerase PptA (4-oxalocrotonate tautomerase family)
MTGLSPALGMTFGGDPGPACFVRVVSIGGFTDEVAGKLVAEVTHLVEEHLGVPPARIYVELAATERARFGWNGEPFG